MDKKLQDFAELLERQQIERLHRDKLDCPSNITNCKVTVKTGKKYIKVDVGSSGKYMIDNGSIFGIKGYGVIHRGHQFGTLDTINNYNWGGYRGSLKN